MTSEARDRPTIGVVIDAVHEPYQSGIWRGIVDRARELNVDLTTFVGTSQDGVDHFDIHYDVAGAFASQVPMDGVIVMSGSMNTGIVSRSFRAPDGGAGF